MSDAPAAAAPLAAYSPLLAPWGPVEHAADVLGGIIALAADLDAFAREQRVSPFMVLLAAYQVLLQRHTGQDDISVGVPVAGRNDPDLEPLESLGLLASQRLEPRAQPLQPRLDQHPARLLHGELGGDDLEPGLLRGHRG